MEKKATIIRRAIQEEVINSKREPDTTIASTKDLEVVFEAIVNPPGPNKSLRDAAEIYKVFIQDHKVRKRK